MIKNKMEMENNSKYDSFGILKNIPWLEIKKGDLVEYIDTKIINKKPIKISLIGIWNGEKVCFTDKDNTIVRTTRWLKK